MATSWGVSWGGSWGQTWNLRYGQGGGGTADWGEGWRHIRHPKTAEDLRREREAWGILPKKVKEIIEDVAEQQVAENWTLKHADAELRRELRLQGLLAEESRREQEYALLLRAEIERILDEEDAIAVIALTLNG